jgi:hypothetical protein
VQDFAEKVFFAKNGLAYFARAAITTKKVLNHRLQGLML